MSKSLSTFDKYVGVLHIHPSENILNVLILGPCFYFLSTDTAKMYWNYVYTNYSAFQIYFYITLGAFASVYWSYSLALMYIDLQGIHSWLFKYKIQKNKLVTLDQYWTCIKQVGFNHIFINIPLQLFIFWFTSTYTTTGIEKDLPHWTTAIQHFMAYGIIEEVWFYYSHRLLHHPSIYRFIHKRHHLFTAPVGMAATFAHPFEHLVSNMAPMVLGPIIMQSHIAVSWIWFNFAIIVTITTHCGYDLWGFPSSLAHDFHHYSFNYNFGVAGILDFLHGTDSAYQVWLAEYRCRDKAKEALNEISNKEE